ncbi:MAG: InlB B-repeat-containing protein, partial [Defluviitaleaceae bacterium]|nr:InlB B-repeat-containing protein [Defluviitaleaceae bacterium]
MKTRTRISRLAITTALTLLMTMLLATVIYAVPANPFPQPMRQADGSIVYILGGGDERFNWLECENGFVVAFDLETQNFTYAYIDGGQLHANPDAIVGQAQQGLARSAQPRLTMNDVIHLWYEADPVFEGFGDFPTFRDTYSMFNFLYEGEDGSVRFAQYIESAMRPGQIVPIWGERQTQHILPVMIEFTEPLIVGGTEQFARFRDSRYVEEYGRPIFRYIYEDLPGIPAGTTATQYWGRKFFDINNPTGSVVHYFNEQAFGVLDPNDPDDQFFIPAPEIQTMFPEGVNRVTGVRSKNAGTGLVFNNVAYEVYLDREWNIFRITLHMAHPSPINNGTNTNRLISLALDLIMYDDYGRDRNPAAQNWTRTGSGGHSATNGIPPWVHLYGIIAGYDGSSNNGFGLGQTWGHMSTTANPGTGFPHGWQNNSPATGNRKRWAGRVYAQNGELFNGNPLTIGTNQLPFATMSIGIITHEFGHTLGIWDTYDTAGNSLSLRPYSLMAHGSWGTVIDEVPGSTPTRLDPLHMLELGMLRPDQLIIVESIEDFDAVLHPFYLSDSFFYDKRLDTPVGSYIPGGTKFLPVNNVPNPDFNILMIWAPEHRAVFDATFATRGNATLGTTHARLVPTEFFLAEFRLPMGYDRGMTRYGIGVNSVPYPDDPRFFHHTARVDARAMHGQWPGAPALTAHNNAAMIDGGVLLFHYDRSASPTGGNPQNANLHHKRADLILADGSDLLRHANNISWNVSYGAHYASHDYFVNQDHFFSASLTRSVIAALPHSPVQLAQGIGAPLIRGDGSALAYQAYAEANLYAAGVRLNRLFSGFSLNAGANPADPSTWQYGTFGRGPETGYAKMDVQTPMPGTVIPASNTNFVWSPGERNTFPTAHFYDRTWTGNNDAGRHASRHARTGNTPSGMDLVFHNTRLEAIELDQEGRTRGMRVTNRVWDVNIEVFLNGQPDAGHNREFVLRLAQYNPQVSSGPAWAVGLYREPVLPIRNHADSVSRAGNVVTIGVTNGEWKIFELVGGEEVFTGYTVIVYEGRHTPVQLHYMNLPYTLTNVTVYNNSLPLVYAIGGNALAGTLDFTNFAARIVFDNNGTEVVHIVPYADFPSWGITTNFSHGDVLTMANNGDNFVLTFRSQNFNLGTFTVTNTDLAVITVDYDGTMGRVYRRVGTGNAAVDTFIPAGTSIEVAPGVQVVIAVAPAAGHTSTGHSVHGVRTNRTTATSALFTFNVTAANARTGVVNVELEPLFTATFNGNGNTGGNMNSVAIQGGRNWTIPANAFTRTNHIFTGWNTLADGTGQAFPAGHAFTNVRENITLFAQWSDNVVTITYVGNGNTGGTMAPTTMVGGTNHVVRANAFTRTGGFIFIGWNTLADGTGAWWHVGNVMQEVTTDARLYAQWAQRSARITQPQSLELLTNEPLRAGRGGNVTFVVETTAFPVHLTELWTVNLYGHPAGVSILTNFMINSGTINDGRGNLTLNVDANVPPGTYPIHLEIVRNRQASPDGAINLTPPVRTPAFNLVILPADDANIGQIAVSYLPNGGVGDVNTSFYNTGANHTVLTLAQSGIAAPGSLEFLGWNTLPTGRGTTHQPGDVIPVPTGGLTLYAMWSAAAVEGITITPNPATVPYNSFRPFTANVETVSGASTEVVWSVTGHANASITSYGRLVTGAIPVGTQLTVTARSTFNPHITGSTVVTVVERVPFGLQVFNNGNDNVASIAGTIRMWTQLNGANAIVPYADLVVTATFPNGQCAMDVVRINRIWNNMGYVNMIDVNKNV